jgi:hypothetical protein
MFVKWGGHRDARATAKALNAKYAMESAMYAKEDNNKSNGYDC